MIPCERAIVPCMERTQVACYMAIVQRDPGLSDQKLKPCSAESAISRPAPWLVPPQWMETAGKTFDKKQDHRDAGSVSL
jgi:hypothetical protein